MCCFGSPLSQECHQPGVQNCEVLQCRELGKIESRTHLKPLDVMNVSEADRAEWFRINGRRFMMRINVKRNNVIKLLGARLMSKSLSGLLMRAWMWSNSC
jgi:hypothetical protein